MLAMLPGRPVTLFTLKRGGEVVCAVLLYAGSSYLFLSKPIAYLLASYDVTITPVTYLPACGRYAASMQLLANRPNVSSAGERTDSLQVVPRHPDSSPKEEK